MKQIFNMTSLWAVGLLAGLLMTLPTTSQAGGFIIHVGPGKQNFPLAVPKPEGAGSLSDKLWEVVLRDLEMTGYFNIIDPDAYIDQSGSVTPGGFNFADWRLVNAAALAKMQITSNASGLQVDLYVYDVNEGATLKGRRLTANERAVRSLGHAVANNIVKSLTGEDSFFGQSIAIVGEQTGNKEIYLMDLDGKNIRPVSKNGSINLSPAWSPDGAKIAWTSYKRNNPDLYVKKLSSGQVQALSAKQGLNIGAAYSPDGKQIAVTRSTRGDSDIYILDAQTGEMVKRITKGGGIDVSPSFSPDGTKLAFASERSGGSQIFVYDLATETTRRVSRQGRFNVDPAWSPDGKKLAFVGRDPRFDIFVLDIKTQRTIRITEKMGDNEDPSWSPDGRYLVFASTRKGRSQIWLSTADGTHQVPVTAHSGGWSQPVWTPESGR